jgi:myo-inositol-1(or 4)-monophosphatase
MMNADSTTMDALTSAAQRAGQALLAAPPPRPAATMEEFRRVFGEVDAVASNILGAELAAIRPGVPVIDDLAGEVPDTGEAWLVDAIDGAVQYMRRLPQWCVSVALVRDGQPVAAVLHNPVPGETYAAGAGRGATRDGQPLRPADTAELRIALLATSHPPFAQAPVELAQAAAARAAGAAMAAVLPRAGAVRNLGPTSWQVADVAGGRLDGFWLFGRDPGNLLAAALVAREAGLAVTDAAGRPWTARSESFLVACPALHAPLRDLLAPACLSLPQTASAPARPGPA